MSALPFLPALPHAAAIVVRVLWAGAHGLLLVYCLHRLVVLGRWWRARRALPGPAWPAPDPASAAAWPVVTVQLPVYNERTVIERLVEAACALDYPAGRLEIQVLDDSSDDTTARAAGAIARGRARGVDIRHVRRPSRGGFKAGALAHGLAAARGELVAVFDADFVPPRDFLARTVPRFADPGVGMVQARWTHLNRRESLLTRAQAVLLDAHFLLEHVSRARTGLFFNFNGAAAVWRRACIEDAGGWSADTLTEDLDLSYRAQLRGWRFAFDPTLEAPGELPADLAALQSQQRRWARGSIQTARKLLPRILGSALPARVKLEAAVHLTANAGYPLVLLLAFLLGPALLLPGAGLPAAAHALLLGCGVLPVVAFLVAGQIAARRPWRGMAGDVLAAIAVGTGLAATNAGAVLAGLAGAPGEWVRTPKSGAGHSPARPRPAGYGTKWGAGRVELALAFHAAALAGLAALRGEVHALPFALLLCASFGAVALSGRRRGAATA